MMEGNLDWLTDAVFLVSLSRVFLMIGIAFFGVRLTLGLLKRKARKRGQSRSLLAEALGFPLYMMIVLLGVMEIAATVSAQVHPDWVAGFRSAEGIGVLVLIFWILLRLISAGEERFLALAKSRENTLDETLMRPNTIHGVGHSLRAVLLVVAGLTIMSNLGIKIEGLLAFGGVGTILIGFMARETLTNYFSGMMIFWDRPFDIGDWIRIKGINVEGVVEAIGWRLTRVQTFDMRPLYVPNSLISSHVIENPQRMTNRRIYEYIGLRYKDADVMPKIMDDISSMLHSHPDIDSDQVIMANFDRYGQSSLDCFVYAMTRTVKWSEYHQVKQKILLEIAHIVRKHGADFAFPTRTIEHAPGNRGDGMPFPPPIAGD